MRCPFCRVDNDRVTNSRTGEDGSTIRRRRQCLACKRRYTTYERVEELTLKVVKKDKSREPFSRGKIRRGLQMACWKRPVSDEQIDALIADVESEVHENFDVEIDAQYLGELVMGRLKLLDQVAYVRFASVYRRFEDIRDFVDELTPMLETPKKRRRREA